MDTWAGAARSPGRHPAARRSASPPPPRPLLGASAPSPRSDSGRPGVRHHGPWGLGRRRTGLKHDPRSLLWKEESGLRRRVVNQGSREAGTFSLNAATPLGSWAGLGAPAASPSGAPCPAHPPARCLFFRAPSTSLAPRSQLRAVCLVRVKTTLVAP